jgi:hypothetical protein
LGRRQIAVLLLLSIGAVLVHGYHPAAEDGELYLPAIRKDLNPALYPFNVPFFLSHAHMTLFDDAVAGSVRISHLPFDCVIFLWHFACIFLFLLGCWRVARICFGDERAAWGSVALIAAVLTIPVAGTALYIMDQCLTPRDISTAGIMLVLAEALEGRLWWAAIWILVIAGLHLLMAVFGIALLFFFYLEECRSKKSIADAKPAMAPVMLLIVLLPFLQPESAVYRRLLETNDSYFLLLRWPWYEWLGIFIPLLVLAWMAGYAKKHGLSKMEALSRASVVFGVVFFAAALILCVPRMAPLALLQPMRCLHLVFIIFFILVGGVLAESWLKSHVWRWVVFLAPLCLLMFFVQRQLFPATEHLELPGRTPRNAWVQAFTWSRDKTPRDAIFALDPNYMNLHGEDGHGFRAIAERSTLAAIRDNGAVSMFPALADEWYQQVQAQRGWTNFQAQDFQRLRHDYGVTWFVLQRGDAIPQSRSISGLSCPYQNNVVMVCSLD